MATSARQSELHVAELKRKELRGLTTSTGMGCFCSIVKTNQQMKCFYVSILTLASIIVYSNKIMGLMSDIKK